jgi:hypothetical protein
MKTGMFNYSGSISNENFCQYIAHPIYGTSAFRAYFEIWKKIDVRIIKSIIKKNCN